jgi:uncharacterized protein
MRGVILVAKFVISKNYKGEYWFVLKSTNNWQTVVTSETYTTKQACKDGINFVKSNAADASTEDTTGER